jgi:hypothetical protein
LQYIEWWGVAPAIETVAWNLFLAYLCKKYSYEDLVPDLFAHRNALSWLRENLRGKEERGLRMYRPL